MASDTEIEETLRKSQETLAASQRLIEAANAALAKDFDKLQGDLQQEVKRMGGVLKTKGAPASTGPDCLTAAFEALGDFADVEVAIIQGIKAGEDPGARKAEAPVRPGPRRGMRV